MKDFFFGVAPLTFLHVLNLVLILILPGDWLWLPVLILLFMWVILWLIVLQMRLDIVSSVALLVILILAQGAYALYVPEAVNRLRGEILYDVALASLPDLDGIAGVHFRSARPWPFIGTAQQTFRGSKHSTMTYSYAVAPPTATPEFE